MITSPPENHPAPPVRLAVVDDDPLVRAGLALMLGGADDIRIVGEAADGADVADLVDRVRPDVVLMDIRMPVVDGLTATEALRARPDAPEVIVLTTFHADEQVLRAIRAGAAGFVLKDTPPAQIVESVRRVAAGDPVLSPAVTRQLMARAAALYLSVATVKTQVSRILTRFDFNNRVQIALLVHDSGLLDDDAAEDGDVG